MRIGDKVEVLVAEPWDFQSQMGSNKITGSICDHTITKYGDTYLMRSNDIFMIQSLQVQYMVLTHRHKEISPEDFDIAYFPENKISQFKELDNIKEYLKFIIIGTVI